ncbi:MAG TPA: glycosyltransferase, partial [Ilumatobacteraceae bacterium]|nr:glycosyltransferase [Ilumatobacteraceae bacterium]
GDDKRRLLAATRVLLNIHRGDEPYFEWLRFIEAFHCGAVVVSEPSIDTAPFVAGRHFVSAAPDALPYVLDAVLDDPDRLQEIRAAAYDELRRHPFSRSLDRLVSAARSLTDARLPHSLPSFTRTTPHAHPGDALLSVDATSPESIMRQQLRELRLDLQGIRRQLTGLQRIVLDPAAVEGAPTTTVCASIAHQLADDAPVVSAVMALYNHGDFVTEALDSTIAAARDVPFEVIVVDDGSTDDSRQIVIDWVRAHPSVRAQVVAHRVNQGLPYARNTGLAAARGEFVFVLDADNEILPDAFATLLEPLTADPRASFSYGLLEAFNQDGAVGSMGLWPWQPKRLRNGNYIDAMAMVRATALRDLDGYTTDRRLYGWEDYDLWCRMAEAGGYGVQIPNFVGRYRRSATSMVSLSNVSEVPAFTALAERCPRLMSGDFDDIEVGGYVGTVSGR